MFLSIDLNYYLSFWRGKTSVTAQIVPAPWKRKHKFMCLSALKMKLRELRFWEMFPRFLNKTRSFSKLSVSLKHVCNLISIKENIQPHKNVYAHSYYVSTYLLRFLENMRQRESYEVDSILWLFKIALIYFIVVGE